MLRELEASAIDRGDVLLNEDSVTIALPVPETDWEAKGARGPGLAFVTGARFAHSMF